MNRSVISILIVVLLASCAPSEESIQSAIAETKSVWTPVPTQTAYPTYTAPPTVFVTVLVTKIVTPTFTAAPKYTPTITSTPTATQDPRTTTKDDGFYLVNDEIAAGNWRSGGDGNNCYWSLTSSNGDIIDNHWGMAGGVIHIPSSAFQVQLQNCGVWTYLDK